MINTALWFSGGKDSMATLLLMRPQLVSTYVLFANTGRYYPEALQLVERVRSMCPHWMEIHTDRAGQWARHGLPSHLVPIDWTVDGQQITGSKAFKIQSYLRCNFENISAPLWAKTRELGCTRVIRGQRADEPHKSAAKHGDRLQGIEFVHPIESWTREQVLDYLKRELGELPEHYALEHSSLDCFDCTAFAGHSLDRVRWMRAKHPRLHAEYAANVNALQEALKGPIEHYRRLAEACEIQVEYKAPEHMNHSSHKGEL